MLVSHYSFFHPLGGFLYTHLQSEAYRPSTAVGGIVEDIRDLSLDDIQDRLEMDPWAALNLDQVMDGFVVVLFVCFIVAVWVHTVLLFIYFLRI